MMRQMRENTKWIMLVTAAAFVGLMVFQWGMDITGRSGLSIVEIGSVNGTPVMYDAFNQTYRALFDQMQASQEAPITSQQIRDIEDAAWDEVVDQVLIRQELRRRGILVTDDELLTAARFSSTAGVPDQPRVSNRWALRYPEVPGVPSLSDHRRSDAPPTGGVLPGRDPPEQADAAGVVRPLHYGCHSLGRVS